LTRFFFSLLPWFILSYPTDTSFEYSSWSIFHLIKITINRLDMFELNILRRILIFHLCYIFFLKLIPHWKTYIFIYRQRHLTSYEKEEDDDEESRKKNVFLPHLTIYERKEMMNSNNISRHIMSSCLLLSFLRKSIYVCMYVDEI